MFNLILTALAPVTFVVLMGVLAGKTRLISSDGTKTLSTAVVNFALPCALFVSTFSFSPTQFENVHYVLTLLISISLPFFVALALAKVVWKKDSPEAALFASNSGFPDMAYFGVPIVITVIGQQGMLPVIVGNLITSFVVVPVIMAMVLKGQGGKQGLSTALLHCIKQPLVWAPILGLILVLFGVKLPELATDSLKLLGGVSGGLALFTLGIMLSFLTPRIDGQVITVVIIKNLVMPGLVLLLALLFKLDPVLAQGAIIIAACPAATVGAMLSSQHSVATDRIPGQILASNVSGIFTMAMWIYVAEKMF